MLLMAIEEYHRQLAEFSLDSLDEVVPVGGIGVLGHS